MTINWVNIEPGNNCVYTHNKYNKYAPVHCAHRIHKDITFTANHCHYYVQKEWLHRQRAEIAEKILDIISINIPLGFNQMNKM